MMRQIIWLALIPLCGCVPAAANFYQPLGPGDITPRNGGACSMAPTVQVTQHLPSHVDIEVTALAKTPGVAHALITMSIRVPAGTTVRLTEPVIMVREGSSAPAIRVAIENINGPRRIVNGQTIYLRRPGDQLSGPAIAKYGPLRVAVVDWDAHHGNGTQSIYYQRSDVLTISLHQDRCFPFGYSGQDDRGDGAGLGLNINIPLPPGSGHDTYLYAFAAIVLPALERFRPELIVVASGLDASALDPLSQMLLHSETFRAMTELVKQAAAQYCGGKLVIVHEGGYSEAYAPFCGHAIVEALAGVRTAVVDPVLTVHELSQPNERVFAFHRELIDEMAAAIAAT